MKKALRLAGKAEGMTSPNPMVGAVLVKNGKIIAEDFHHKHGSPHAEALVIEEAKEKAKGATLYVNLEPCCHTEKTIPPCTKAIIKAGIKKVVIGMMDPNPLVSGKGIKELETAGIKIVSGVCGHEAEKLNEAYVKYITTNAPFVVLKVAMTLDGKIATPEGESKWITGEKARTMVRILRSKVDAVVTAIGTIKADDPQLTARIKGKKDPKRIVIDPDLEIPIGARVLQQPPETVIVTKNTGDKAKQLEHKGIKFIHYQDKLNLKWLMKKLGEMKMTYVMIEGGSSLNSHAIEEGIVDKAMFFIAPKIIGGKDSYPAVGGSSFRQLSDVWLIKDLNVKKTGEDILVEGYMKNNQT